MIDADGVTVIANWGTEFSSYASGAGVPPTNPAAIGTPLSLGLTAAGTEPATFIRANANAVVRYIHLGAARRQCADRPCPDRRAVRRCVL